MIYKPEKVDLWKKQTPTYRKSGPMPKFTVLVKNTFMTN